MGQYNQLTREERSRVTEIQDLLINRSFRLCERASD
jgi:hypothetical protein